MEEFEEDQEEEFLNFFRKKIKGQLLHFHTAMNNVVSDRR
jgi:hypothetical protein